MFYLVMTLTRAISAHLLVNTLHHQSTDKQLNHFSFLLPHLLHWKHFGHSAEQSPSDGDWRCDCPIGQHMIGKEEVLRTVYKNNAKSLVLTSVLLS